MPQKNSRCVAAKREPTAAHIVPRLKNQRRLLYRQIPDGVKSASAAPLRSIFELSLEGEALSERMSKEKPMIAGHKNRKGAKPRAPEWADGLKRLYDSVLDEPLPDSFAQLLDKLDGPPHG